MRRRDPDRTRDDVLQAAFEEMHEHGYQAANLDRILKRCGLSKGAMYHHFTSKEEMGLAVLDEVIGGYFYQFRIAPLERSDDPIPLILESVKREFGSMSEGKLRLGCPINNLSHEMSPLNESFRRHLEGLIEGWRSALAGALRRGQVRGSVRDDIDCDETALFIVAAHQGCASLGKTYQSTDALQGWVRQLGLYLRSLQP